FELEAELFENGREIGQTSGPLLLENQSEFVFNQSSNAAQSAAPVALAFTIDRFLNGREGDEASISFDLYRKSGQGAARDPIVSNWAAVCRIGEPFSYDVTDAYRGAPGRVYELRFVVRLAR